jgi:hypothetical protein
MRITFILPGIRGPLSGGSRVVFEYANRLADKGHDVYLVYPLLPIFIVPEPALTMARQRLGALKGLYNGNSVKWFDLRAKLVRVPSLDPGSIRFIEGLVPDSDAIIATAWETAYAVSKLSERKGKKFYFIQHYEAWGLWDDESCWAEAEKHKKGSDAGFAMAGVTPKNSFLKRYKEAVDTSYELPLIKITISTWLKRLLEENFGGPVEGPVINGINSGMFYPDPSPVEKKHLRILMPWRPYKNKGSEDGIKAFSMVRAKHPDIDFVLYGIKRPDTIPPWASFVENASDDELRRLYSDADIFVCPSWVEGFGLTPMEASACGCAVVATNVGAVPDYAVNGKTIVSTPPRDPEALADAILCLVEDEGRRKAIASGGNEYIKQFSWDRATGELEQILVKYVGKV